MPAINSRVVVVGPSLVFALSGVACIDPTCAKGYRQEGNTCYRIRDAGPEAGAVEDDAEIGDGGSAPQANEDDAGADHPPSVDAGPDTTAADMDPCDPNPCAHGGKCARSEQELLCDCGGTGFEGAMCERDIDECAALNSCTSSNYPCVQTEPPGYTCQGQFADWPMPDAVSGAKVKPSYAVTADPAVVIDQVTGLVWQRSLPAIYAGCTGGGDEAGDSCTWQEAKEYCRDLVLGGFDDWRLPSKIEIESIANDTRSSPPALDTIVFPDVPADGSGTLWSSSRAGSSIQQLAIVVLSNGGTAMAPTEAAVRVRCVRGLRVASGTPAARYRVNAQGVASVSDTRTGLTWQRNIDEDSYSRSGAIDYCSGLGAGWRLPTKKELLTLVDSMRLLDALVDGAIDLNLFPSIPAEIALWSISPRAIQAAGEPNYWAVATTGIPLPASDAYLARVRCVR